MSSHGHSHHDHDHHAGHVHHSGSWTRSFLLATIINFSFVIAEIVYALIANSMSLLADAGHNLGDVLGLGMSALAFQLTRKSSSRKYSYGFKRTTILAALFNAILLITSTVFILIEATQKLIHPVAVEEKIIILVAAIGILVNGGTALLFIRSHHDLNVKGAFLHLAYDALISLGVVIGGILLWFTGWLWIDSVLGILIALTIFYGTWGLLRQALDLSLDAVPASVDENKVLSYLQTFPGVKQVHHLHIWSLSTQEVALTAHLVIPDPNFTDEALFSIQKALASQFNIGHATLQVEKALIPDACEIC